MERCIPINAQCCKSCLFVELKVEKDSLLMEFLGHSQTFIGVLTSLIVLCILDSGNFIHGILEKIGERITTEIKQLDRTLDLKGRIEKEPAYKLFSRFIKNPNESNKQPEEIEKLLGEALELDMDLNASFSKFKSGSTPKFIKPASLMVEKIKESREQLIAPLYVLLYCMVVFICDEIIAVGWLPDSLVVTTLTVFTFFSFVFWVTLWYMFYYDIKNEPQGTEKQIKKKTRLELWICKHAGWINVLFLILLLCTFFIFLFVWTDTITYWYSLAFIVALFLLFVAVIAVCRVRSHDLFGHYLYEFSLRHFGGILALSFLFGCVFWGWGNYYPEVEIYYWTYNDFTKIKVFIITFIIVNGLIAPFVIPYEGFLRIFREVQMRAQHEEAEFERKVEENNEKLKEFCEKI